MTECIKWVNTVKAIEELLASLSCSLCNSILSRPSSVGRCYHLFCNSCIVNYSQGESSTACPECKEPFWECDINVDHQIEQIILLCQAKLPKFKESLSLQESTCELQSEVQDQENSDFHSPASYVTASNLSPIKQKDLPDTPETVDLSSPVLQPIEPFLEIFEDKSNEECSDKEQKTEFIQPSLPATPGESSTCPSQHVRPVEITYKRRSKRASSITDVIPPQPEIMEASSRTLESINTDKISEAGSNPEEAPSRRSKRLTGEKVTVHEDTILKTPQRKKICKNASSVSEKKLPLYTSPSSSPLLTLGKKSAAPSPLTKRNYKGETPLHRAVIAGNVERTTELLQHGDVDPNAKDNAGWTPLHDGCHKQRFNCVRVLLEHGADVNCKSNCLDTPLHDACAKGSVELIKLLLDHGADRTIRNEAGLTAIDYTNKKEVLDLVTALSEKTDEPTVEKKLYLVENQPTLLFSGVHPEDLAAIKKNKLRFDVKNSFTDQITHLICGIDTKGHCKRTIKFFEAMAKGLPILSLQWVTDSVIKETWQPMNSYFVKGISGYKDGSPKHSYENRLKPGLLTGLSVYLDKNLKSVPNKDILINLISTCNATILAREPKTLPEKITHKIYHAKRDSVFNTVPYVIISNNAKCSSLGIPVRQPSWLLDCITNFTIIE